MTRSSRFLGLFVLLACLPLLGKEFSLYEPTDHCLLSYYAINDAGEKKSIEEHAESMRFSGYNGARRLLGLHEDKIPSHSAVLEVGPYYNPLGNQLKVKHPWLVWEYDTAAAAKLKREDPNTVIFQADLSKFDGKTWNSFLNANSKKMDEISGNKKAGALILSSVLNYFDFKQGLEKMVPKLDEGGLLIVSNTDHGDGPFMYKGQPIPTGREIFETLVRLYPNQLTVLEGSKVESGLGMSRIQLAAKLNWKNKRNSSDIYEMGIGFMADDLSRNVQGIMAVENDLTARTDASAYMNRTDAKLDAAKIDRWKKVRTLLIAKELERRHKELWQLARWEKGSAESEKMKTDLTISRHNFRPENQILLQALEIADPKARTAFLKKELGDFYGKMGHEMPNLDGPEPAANDDFYEPRNVAIRKTYGSPF